MPHTTARLLIVDDEPSVLTTLAQVLGQIGYHVRTAEDGFSALRELRHEVPDILLCDLNMPGMSGFELLSVVRRRFPAIHAIAMSGAFQGDEVPSGVAAAAFYHKGSSIASLLRIIEVRPRLTQQPAPQPSTATEPVWVQMPEPNSPEAPSVAIVCPECLRSFPQPLGTSPCLTMRETECIHCRASIRYVVVEPTDRTRSRVLKKRSANWGQTPSTQSHYYY